MSELYKRALDGILKGDAGLRAEFSLSRVTTTGQRTGSGIFEWEDRLEIRGDGTVRQTTFRSFADGAGQEPGIYEITKPASFVLNLVGLVREAGLDRLPPGRVEPNDVAIRLKVAAGGETIERAFAAADHLALQSVQSLLNEFIPLTLELLKAPLMTLRLDLIAHQPIHVGQQRLRMSLAFSNSGTTGYWLIHPANLVDDGRFEQCGLLYGLKPLIQPDLMPKPIQILRATLAPLARVPGDLIWIAPHSEVRVDFATELLCPEPGDYFMRAAFSTYAGDVTARGQPRFIGGVFSNDIEASVT